jgi:chitin disaccharide deacetylase
MAQVPPGAKHVALCIDDFGLHEGVDNAALELAQRGRVTAISCMVGAPHWEVGALKLSEVRADDVDIGLHLDFTEHPISAANRWKLPQLIAASTARLLDRGAVRTEIDAQLDKFEQGLGRAPSHVDGHQHIHQFPVLRDALLQALLERYPDRRPWLRRTARRRTGATGFKPWLIEHLGSAPLAEAARRHGFAQNECFLGVYDFTGDAASYRARLVHWLQAAREGDLLMCHPALGAPASDAISPARTVEYSVLASDAFPQLLAGAGVTLAPISRLRAHA